MEIVYSDASCVFHLQEMYKYMLKHHKKPARIDICNDANLTPLTLASRLGRHKIFKEILELNSIVSLVSFDRFNPFKPN